MQFNKKNTKALQILFKDLTGHREKINLNLDLGATLNTKSHLRWI
jgi:hypothetical protein